MDKLAKPADILLDALGYHGEVDWLHFKALVQALGDDMAGATTGEMHRLLALGHIDLERESGDFHVARIRVAPPVLYTLPGSSGRAILAGARAASLLDSIESMAAKAGGKVEARYEEAGPAIVSVTGLEPRQLEELTGSLVAPGNNRVRFSSTPALSLAAALPTLENVVEGLPARHFREGDEFKAFDFERGGYHACTAASNAQPRVYRFDEARIAYGFYRPSDGRLALADYRLAKHAVGRQLGLALLCYDPSSCILSTKLGAELPDLYERVAVACSGTSPVVDMKARETRYHDVPPFVAARLWQLLGPGQARQAA